MALTQVKWLHCACGHGSTDLCSGYYGVHELHLISELCGIYIGFHVDSTVKSTHNWPALYHHHVLNVMYGYYSGMSLSTLSC